MHAYQTLVREIVTPTLPAFAAACLQILKPPASSKTVKTPYSLVETVFESISVLLPLYPTTLRQVSAKIRADARPYLVPTGYECAIIPRSLQESSRHLVIRLHMTATKSGDAAEWTKHIEMLIKEFLSTADQVFRPVHENWESTSGYIPQPVNFDLEPQGGSDQPEKLPQWLGIQAGSERMIGILEFIGDCLRCSTRSAVTIPISAIADAIMRVSVIIPPSPGKDKFESIQTNPAVGREERDEFWAVFPDIQAAALKLHLVLIQRLGRNFIPVAQEALDQVLRIFESSFRLPEIRTIAFIVMKKLLDLIGPTMAKPTVEELGLVVKSCCRDLLGAAGHLKCPTQQATSLQNGSKPKTVTQNADAFLSTKTEEETISVSLSEEHLAAAEALLATLFRSLPQQHLPSALRIRMLRTAILCQIKVAQMASVLHPSRDSSGGIPQVILPYLTRQFPYDQDVELLRFNFRPFASGFTRSLMVADDDMLIDEEPKATEASDVSSFGQPFGSSFPGLRGFSNSTVAPEPAEAVRPPSPVTLPTAKSKESPFLVSQTQTTVSKEDIILPPQTSIPLKRKNEEEDIIVPKRTEIKNTKTVEESYPTITNTTPQLGVISEEDSDDESVHLTMELDSSSDDEEDDEGGE